MLAKALLNDFRKELSGKASTILGFFCKSGVRDRNKAVCMVKSFLYRLLSKHKECFRHVTKYDGSSHSGDLRNGLSEDSLWIILIDILSDSVLGSTYIVVDGLDECEEDSQKEILRWLKKVFVRTTPGWTEFPTEIHFLVTSQPTAPVKRRCQQFEKINIENADVTPDIGALIKFGVEELALDETQSQTVRDRVRKRLEEGAQGTFLWTALLLEELDRLGVDITKEKINNILEGIPQGLEEYYARILERIIESRQDEDAARIFNVLLSAQRSLRQDELAVAIHLFSRPSEYSKHSDFEGKLLLHCSGYAKEVCKSLIKVTDTRIEIVHQSAKAFLLSLSSNPKYTPLCRFIHDPLTSHDLMSRICLQYLLLKEFTEMKKKFGVFRRYPFISYAGEYWTYHVRESKLQLVECKPWLRMFLKKNSPSFAFWFLCLRFPIWKGLFDFPRPTTNTSPPLLHMIVQHRLLNVIEQNQIEIQNMNEPYLQLDINERDRFGRTPLHTAVTIRDGEILQQLLALHADPNLADEDDDVPLHEAVRQEHVSAIDMLCEAGANLEQKTKDYQTPLYMTVRLGHSSLVDRLLKKGADVTCTTESGWTVLHSAAQNGHVAMMDRLVELGVDSKTKSNDG